MKYLFRILTCGLLLAGGGLCAQASPPSPPFPPGRHAELRREIAYVPPQESTRPPADNPLEWSFSSGQLQTFWTLVLSAIVLAVLGFLIYRVIGEIESRRANRPTATPATSGVGLSEVVEETLVATGVSTSLLERAEAAGQYDLAVRLLYIRLLKELNDTGLIDYRRDYSNRDYRHQLADHPLAPAFAAVTHDYERYWYGKYRIDRLSYRLTHQKFTELERRTAVPIPQTATDA